MPTVNLTEFLAYARTQQGKKLQTRVRHTTFVITCEGDDWIITPTLGVPHKHTKAYITKVLDQFNKTHSFKVGDYRFTVNASYQLALIDMFLADRKHKKE